jgi:hypothetical protein
MKNLEVLKFSALSWHNSTIEVEGQLSLIDHKTLGPFEPTVNRNGYLMVIINEKGTHIIQPDTVKMINIDPRVKKWEDLGEKIARCYFDENGDDLSEEESENIDLGTIGEIAASAYGWL